MWLGPRPPPGDDYAVLVEAVLAAESFSFDENITAYVDTLPDSASGVLTASEHGFGLGEGVELRAVGSNWAAVEDNGEGHIVLSVHAAR